MHAVKTSKTAVLKGNPFSRPLACKATIRCFKNCGRCLVKRLAPSNGYSKTLHELVHAERHRYAICERAKLIKRKSSSARLLWGMSAPSKELGQALGLRSSLGGRRSRRRSTPFFFSLFTESSFLLIYLCGGNELVCEQLS